MVPFSNAGTASPSIASTTPGPNQLQQQNQLPPPRSTSLAPTDPNSNAPGAQHKRVYQACIPCRRRKVRCDLGSVDNPHDPPCVRCRRESKECFFSATRRKRKADDGEVSEDEYIVRNGRKRLNNANDSASRTPPPIDPKAYSDVPLTPGGSQGRSKPLRRPDEHGDEQYHGDANQQLENFEAQTVMRRGVYGPHDALDLLYKAATDRSVASEFNKAKNNTHASSTPPQPPGFQHQRHESRSSSAAGGVNGASGGFPKPVARSSSFGGLAGADSRQDRVRRELHRHASDVGGARSSAQQGGRSDEQHPVDPGLMEQDPTTQPGYNDAIRAWQRFRFVRAGWFTPQEAIQYIDYYYKYLSPMTPISPPTFSNPASHINLLTDEPILSVTLLTIASRYMRLEGPGGHCRSYAIHEQLWTYLRGMIERCLWGQEAFGSGFCGSGSATVIEEANQTSSTAPWRGMRKGSLRTLGTIESLLILTEWHPRALHFPPQDATDELMLPDFEAPPVTGSEHGEDGAPRKDSSGFGGKRIESWLEPAWRSDRMCWMLLSTGMGLAYELGVFDDMEEMIREEGADRPEFLDNAYRARANRIKRLLLIYTTQLAGRLGWSSMAPDELRRNDPAFARRSSGKKQPNAQQTQTGTGNANDEPTPGTTFSALSNVFNYIPDMELDDQIIHCWAGISYAMHMGNDKLFRSRRHTQEIIQSGKYVSLLGDFGPMLKDWAREFELFRLPPFIRCILKIEYEYVRIYVNSLSLQAVVERCTNNATGATGQNGSSGEGEHQQAQQEQAQKQPQAQQPQQPQQGQDHTGPPQLSPQTIMNYGKLPLGQLGGFTVHDQEYVREVVEGSRNLLNEVVTGLLPNGYLKHAPVRTYFRIISGAMFLLKTFALGAPRSDVKASIDLMDSTVEALRNCVVDDVHLGIRFADLLESLTSRLRNRFIQAPTIQQVTSGRGQSPVAGAEAAGGPVGGDWIGGHAQSLRDGLSGQFRPMSPTMEANNISATPFDLSASSFPYPGGASLGPSTPAAALDLGNHSNGQHHAQNSTPNHAAPNGGIDATLFDEWNNPGNEMWYLPPGPAFFQNVGVGGDSSAVAMTSEGVNIGGLDLLDYMGMDSAQYGGTVMEF